MEMRALELNSGCSNLTKVIINDYTASRGEKVGEAIGSMFGNFGTSHLIEPNFYIGTKADTEFLIVVRGTQINPYTVDLRTDEYITLRNGNSFCYQLI